MRLSLLLTAALCAATGVQAENRAVVVGNADYQNAPDLAGADTSALATILRGAGFSTAQGIDQRTTDMRLTLDLLARTDDMPGARIVSMSGRFVNSPDGTWFLGTEADSPDTSTVRDQGIPLSLIMQLMADATPGAVLLLGTDNQAMPRQPGLETGIGTPAAVDGVSVITGSPEATAKALRELAAGRSVGQALAIDPGLALLPGGNAALLPAAPAARPAPPDRTADPVEADRAAWAAAAGADTPESYGGYLGRYPTGLYAEAAQARRKQLQERNAAMVLDRNVWANAAATNSRAAYQGYLTRFTNGAYAASAERRLAELRQASRPAPPRPPIQPARPETPQTTEAGLRLDRNARLSLQRGLSRLGYEPGDADGNLGGRTRAALTQWQRSHNFNANGYLTLPQFRALLSQVAYLDGDNGRRDRNYWLQTGANGGMPGLRAYLKRYPEGRYAPDARRQLNAPVVGPILDPAIRGDAMTWRWARRQDTTGAYGIYLDRFPTGNYANEARQRRSHLLTGIEAARREEDALDLQPQTRRLIEERLGMAGLGPGPVDGRFTEETRQALRSYQASRNLRVTGYLSQQTVGSLLAGVLRPSR